MTAASTADEILDVTHGRIARGSPRQQPGKPAWNVDEVTLGDWFVTATHHLLPSKARDAQVAAVNCEILETVNEHDDGMAVVYDLNPAVHERSRLLLKGLKSICFSDDSLSQPKSALNWLGENSGVTDNQTKVEPNAWCALTAAVCLGFSPKENPHIVSEVVVGAGCIQ